MIEVYGRANSVNVQKVLWCLDELDVPFEQYDVGGLYGGNREPDFLERNPTGLVPMISDEGFDLWESNAIVRYLSARYGTGSLWPNDPADRALADKWMDYQLGTVFPAFKGALLGLVRTPPEDKDPEAIASSAQETADALAVLDAHLQSHGFVAGNRLTMGDIVLGPTVYRWLNLDIKRPSLPHLEAWHERLSKLPAYQKNVMVSFAMEST